MLQGIDRPEEWRQAADALVREGGVGLILGPTSSGKTTFLKYLVHEMSGQHESIAVVDADIGQSTLGPPAAISGLILDPGQRNLEAQDPRYMYFVGSTSPSGCPLRCVAGAKRLVEWGLSGGPFACLVDTTGMVQGRSAWVLKYHKIDLLRPRHLFVLQRAGELEPILRPFAGREGLSIHRLPVSPRVRRRSPEARRSYRVEKYRAYFKTATMRILKADQIDILSVANARSSGGDLPVPRRLLVGLNDANQRTLALGILDPYDPDSRELFVHTPLQDLTGVTCLLAGSVRVDLEGGEWPEAMDRRRN